MLVQAWCREAVEDSTYLFLRKERELGGWGGKEEPKVTATLKSSHPGGLERWFND